jgi:signal transduction histidine kinase
MGKFGLVGMEERVQLLGGRIQIHSELSKGTMLVVDTSAEDSTSR